jgi:uncharacterized membrane protein YbhN (UPF0104 family)
VAVSLALLVLVARYVDADAVLSRLSALRPGWVAAALAVSVLQVGVLAWRWRYTAARIGIDLPLRAALEEYYLGILLNQLLPGGIAGDVSRAWRHARREATAGPAVRAVILERASAQVVMTLTAVVSLLVLPWATPASRVGVGVVGAAALATALAALARRSESASLSAAGHVLADARRALLDRQALPTQTATALLVVASYLAVFLMAARAVGVTTPTAVMLPLVAPVLMTMLVPVTVAGWGIREVAAASLWALAGLTPEDGAAISVAYGLLVLVSSAPGLVALMSAVRGGPGRRARPPRA